MYELTVSPFLYYRETILSFFLLFCLGAEKIAREVEFIGDRLMLNIC